MNVNVPPSIFNLQNAEHEYTLVYREKTGFQFGDIYFDCSGSQIHKKSKPFPIRHGLMQRSITASRLLLAFNKTGSILDASSRFHTNLFLAIIRLARVTEVCDISKVQENIPFLVGLGNGFTPSGDDFLAGFLYCLSHLTRDADRLSLSDIRIEGNTNWASMKFLEYALEGSVIEPLESFVSVLLGGTGTEKPDNEIEKEKEKERENLDEAIGRLCKVGHSSGVDASVGAIMATCYEGMNGDRYRLLIHSMLHSNRIREQS